MTASLTAAWNLSRSRIPLLGPMGRGLLLAVVVGALSGLGAVGFYSLLQGSTTLIQSAIIGYEPPEALGEPPVFSVPVVSYRPWLFLLIPGLGGLLSGWIVSRTAPEAAGHGTDAVIRAYHRNNGEIRAKVPFVKAITAAITIGTGGSGGREGPIAQIGAGMASWLGRTLGLSASERRTLMAAGMGAGVGAIFRAPLAGALFSGEILYGTAETEAEVLVPAIIASVTAYSVFTSVFGSSPLFRVPDVSFSGPLELIPYSVLAVAAALMGWLYVTVFYGVHNLFSRLGLPAWVKPGIGGLLTGCVAFFTPGAAFTGYGAIQEGLLGHSSVSTLLSLAFLRILTTSFSIGSGGSGGVFGPSMVVGGCLGGAVGMYFYQVWPAAVPNPAAFVIVGMAGFFSGIAHAPISTIVMVGEMTGNYQLLAPCLWVCALTFLLCSKCSLYREQVGQRSDSPAHRAEFAWTSFERMKVHDFMTQRVVAFPSSMQLAQARDLAEDQPHRHYPVLDTSGHVVGVLDLGALVSLSDDDLTALQDIPVHDIMRPAKCLLEPSASLAEAASALVDPGVEMVPVVDPKRGVLCGVLTRSDLLRAHEEQFAKPPENASRPEVP